MADITLKEHSKRMNDARTKQVSPERRSEIARSAANARHARKKKKKKTV